MSHEAETLQLIFAPFHLPAPDRATFTQQGVVPQPPPFAAKRDGVWIEGRV